MQRISNVHSYHSSKVTSWLIFMPKAGIAYIENICECISFYAGAWVPTWTTRSVGGGGDSSRKKRLLWLGLHWKGTVTLSLIEVNIHTELFYRHLAVSSRSFDLLTSIIFDLKISVNLRWLFDPVLHSSLYDLGLFCRSSSTWAMYGVSIAPNRAMLEQLPTPIERKVVG